jgi:thymidylate synthase (FAD)
MQDNKNRQNSLDTDDAVLVSAWKLKQQRVIETTQEVYDWAIRNGIAKEQARAVLPEGITTSRLYMQGTLRSWLHYIELRSGPETQKEHREVAQACAQALESIFPMVTEFLVK